MVKDKEFYKRLSQLGLKARWKKEHSKFRITDKLSTEKIRINAYLCGDGWIAIRKDKNNNTHYEIKCALDNEELVKEVGGLFKKEFNILPKIKFRQGCYHLLASNKPICLSLLSLGNYYSSNWQIPKNLSKDNLIEWIKCFFDCEAHVNIRNKTIQVKSINFKGLSSIMQGLKSLYINSKVYGPYKPKNPRHNLYGVLNISGKEVFEYKRLINFYHPSKKEKLNKIVSKPRWPNGTA